MPAPPVPAPPVLSVLVVDDHPAIREGLSDLLSVTDGLAVWGTAESGDDALAQLEATEASGTSRQGGPGVVVTDLRMPGMDGITLVAEVRVRWPGLPCLVLSAQWSRNGAEQARAAGAAAYVEKGDVDGLVQTIFQTAAR